MQHKWQFETSTIFNTRRKNPRPHSIIVTFRAVVPELWHHKQEPLVGSPVFDLDPQVSTKVLKVIQEVTTTKAKLVGFSVDSPRPNSRFVWFNTICGRIDFSLGTTPAKVRAFEDKLRAAVDKFASESGIPYHADELV